MFNANERICMKIEATIIRDAFSITIWLKATLNFSLVLFDEIRYQDITTSIIIYNMTDPLSRQRHFEKEPPRPMGHVR